MRHPRLSSIHVVAAALVIAGVFAPTSSFAQAQPPAQTPAPAPAPAPPLGPYKPVAITLAAYAAETTVMADPQRKGVFCAPAEPVFDERAADELANVTQTDAADWAFPIRDGIEVRAAAKQDAAVVDKLGLYLVRVLPDDSPANAVLATFAKVITAGGKVGYVPIDTILPIGGEQLCYLKDAGTWKIAGFLGGEPNH